MKNEIFDYTVKIKMYGYMKAFENKENCTIILTIDQFEDIRETYDYYDPETGDYINNGLKDYLKEKKINLFIKAERFPKKR